MSFTVTDAFVQQFTGNVSFLAQQKKSRLRGTILEDNLTGEKSYLEQLAPTAARKVIARHGDSPMMNQLHLRRQITAYDYDAGDLIDKEDKVRLLIDPTSAYAVNFASAMGRAWDDEAIACAWATAYTGHAGGTSVTWPNGNSEGYVTMPPGTQVGVNDWTYGNGTGNAGLTVSKLISASVALDQAEGDEDEERYILIGAKQKGNLLATTEATSADYNTVRALYDGKIDTFMGFKFIHTERLQLDGSGFTRVMAWRKSAIGMGIAADVWTMASMRADKRFSWYAYTAMSVGASRLEEPKLAEIKCA